MYYVSLNKPAAVVAACTAARRRSQAELCAGLIPDMVDALLSRASIGGRSPLDRSRLIDAATAEVCCWESQAERSDPPLTVAWQALLAAADRGGVVAGPMG